jgi:hypothetical protein
MCKRSSACYTIGRPDVLIFHPRLSRRRDPECDTLLQSIIAAEYPRFLVGCNAVEKEEETKFSVPGISLINIPGVLGPVCASGDPLGATCEKERRPHSSWFD